MKYLSLFVMLVIFSCKEDATSKLNPNSQAVDSKEYNQEINKIADEKVEKSVMQNQSLPELQPIVNQNTTTVTFNKKEHDFGTIEEGKIVTTNFIITNSGNKDLIIENATASCGCTVPEFPRQPIKPGKSGKIKVSFDSTGKPGQQQKSVTVTANIPNGSEILNIKTNVNPKISDTPKLEVTQ